MKTKIIQKMLLCTAILHNFLLSAQDLNLVAPAQKIANQVKSIFTYVVIVIFIVVIFNNLGHFAKDGGDWKKGAWNIVLYAFVIGGVVVIFKYVSSITL